MISKITHKGNWAALNTNYYFHRFSGVSTSSLNNFDIIWWVFDRAHRLYGYSCLSEYWDVNGKDLDGFKK